MSGSSSFFVEEAGMGKSSERLDLVDSDSEGDVKEETQEEFARVEREINLLKKEKAVALLRGYPKKWVTEIQKKLSEKETWLGVKIRFGQARERKQLQWRESFNVFSGLGFRCGSKRAKKNVVSMVSHTFG